MAISLNTAGSWVAANATTQTVTLPTHATGNMLLVRVAFKHATMPTTVTCGTAGWAKIGEKNSAGGASSNGGGGVQVAVFWKVAASGAETNPVITFNGGAVAATPSAAVASSYAKAAGDSWFTPVGDGSAFTAATSISDTIDSHISAITGDLIEVLIATNDNTTLTVPTFTQTGLTLAAVVESPATALSDTLSNDIAADGCYRIVTAGTSSAAAVVTGTNSVADEGCVWTTRLRAAVFTDASAGHASGTGAARAPVFPSAYRDAVNADSPLAYFRLGEPSGTDMNDETGNHNGIYAGSPTLAQTGALVGDANTAVKFDHGFTQYGKVAAWTTIPNKPVTLECWAKHDSAIAWPTDTSLGGWLSAVGVLGCQLYVTGNGTSTINLRIGTENGNANADATSVLAGAAWVHVVGTIDSGGDARLYFNGTLVAGPTAVTFSGGASVNPFKVATMDADGTERCWPGTIDEWAVYDTALSQARITAHYTAGLGATNAAAGHASGTGAASAAAASIKAVAGQATGTGTAHNATVSVAASTNAAAGHAAATGTAYQATVNPPVWTTPTNGAAMSTVPDLKFTIPISGSPQHFHLELDTAATFDSGNLRTYRSDQVQTSWDYWNGSAFVDVPIGGVPAAFSGNEARLTVQTPLAAGTWFRRVRAGVVV